MLMDFLTASLGEGTPHHTSKGLQYSYVCPFCSDHKERLFVNVDRQVFICHNCETSGSAITLISMLEGISWKEALEQYRTVEGYDKPLPASLEQEVYSRLLAQGAEELTGNKYVYPLPEEFILLEDAKGPKGRQAQKYMISRGVTPKMWEKYYIGYCAEGVYADRVIMPDFEDNELIYWQARSFLPAPKLPILKKMFRKALNPHLTKEQVAEGIKAVDKSEVISNIDFILQEGMAVLCEGKMDAYTIGDFGGCLHGKVMSDAQFIKLVSNRKKIGTVAVMLDGDAVKNALVVADRLYKHFEEVLMCILPKDADPNSLGREGVLKYLQEAEHYSPSFAIKCRLKGWT